MEAAKGSCVRWNIGALRLHAERYEQEWHILPVYEEKESEESSFAVLERQDKPQSSDWRHYLMSAGDWLHPAPLMMDKPVVIRPDRTLVLSPGERTHFFIALPVWIRLKAASSESDANGKKLFECPLVQMQNTWFGDPVSGEQCYFAESRLYLDFAQLPFSAARAICPLWISNESDKELPFDRICVHTDMLGIYRGETRLWTNEVSVVFKGNDQTTQIQTSRSAPAFERTDATLAEPQQTGDAWHIKRTFSLLKSYTGF